jgi:hypothetical protein
MSKRSFKFLFGIAFVVFGLTSEWGANATGTDVLEYHGNTPTSTGVNSLETQITPGSVNVSNFGEQFSTSITDVPNLTGIPSSTLPPGYNFAAPGGQVYGEPLVKTGVNITTGSNQGVHDVVFVTTTMDSLYAIDANGGTILWKDSFIYNAGGNPNPLNPAIPSGVTAVPGAYGTETNSQDIQPWIGIIDTPVIDGVNGYIYFVAKTREADGNENQPHYVQTLHKVNLSNGLDTNVVIADTTLLSSTTYSYNSGPYVSGTGTGGVTVGGQNRIYFNAVRQMVRPALVLYGGRIYTASASHGDNDPYHGWILTYDATTLALNGVWNSTPNGSGGEAGIWQGGGGVIIDPANGYIYAETGNGDFDGVNSNGTITGLDANGFPVNADYGDCFVKLAIDSSTTQTSQGPNGWGLKLLDYFSPYNNAQLDSGDVDLGSGGPTLLPDSVGSTSATVVGNATPHPHLLIGGGKEGKLYLIDRDNMGKFGTTDNVVQTLNGSLNGTLSVPTYFNGRLYASPGYGGPEVSWPISNAVINTAGLQSSPESIAFPGCSPYISANGTTNGVMWVIDHGTGQLRAYDASNLPQGAIWTSNQNPTRDSLGSVVKFSVPTPVNGRVYVGTSDHLIVYGPPIPPTGPPAAPANLTASATSATTVSLTWTDNSNNESAFLIERSSNGTNFTQIASVGVNVTAYGDSGLSSQGTYYYRVRATNSFNTVSYSAYTNVQSVTTPSIGTQLPVDLYAFDEGTGTTTIDSVGGNDGTLIGSPPPVWVTPGRVGNANLSFSGSGAYDVNSQSAVQVANDLSSVLGSTSSLLFWIHTTQTGNNTYWQAPAVTGVEAGGSANDIGWGYLDATGRICVCVGDSGSVKSANPVNDGNWHYIALTRDAVAGTVNIYVDGVLSSTGTLQTGNKTSRFTLIGARSVVASDGVTFTGANFLNAQLDDVRIYNVVVTAATVASLGEPPAAASNLVLTPASGTELDLSWVDNATNATGYEVWSSDNGGPYTRLAQLPATATTYISGGLTQGTLYYYFVRAISASGSADSPIESATTPVAPATPTNATVVGLTPTEVDMTWTDNANNEVGYRVLRRTNQADFAQIAQLPPNSSAYSDTTAQAGVTYDYHIQAYNIAGVSDFTGFTVTVPTTLTVPPAATGLATTATTANSVSLSWVDNALNESSYQVWGSSNGGTSVELAQLPANSTSVTLTGLNPGVTYAFYIVAVNTTGSTNSTPVSVTIPSSSSPFVNGTYKIVSDSSGLALAANGTSNGSAVVQQTYTSAATQQWTVTNLGNNVIEMALSGTSEALQTPQASAGTNLTVSAYTGSTSQQWTVVASGSGFYELVNVATGFAVNVGGNSTTPGATICQWNANATLNELWSFTAAGGTTPPVTYALTVNGGSGSGSYAAGTAVTVTANAAPSGSQFSAWTGNTAALASSTSATTTLTMPAAATSITATYTPVVGGASPIANGTYQIVSNNSSLVMAANGATSGSAVVQQTYTSAATQQWTVTNLGNNVIEMALTGTSEALGTPQAAAGTNLTVSAYTGSTSQQWTVVTINPGSYELVNVGTGYLVNVSGASTLPGASICQWYVVGTPNSLWSFTAVSGSTPPTTYALMVNSGTGGGSYAAGTVVTVSANTAPAGSQFSAWTGNTSALASSTSATTTLTMPAAALSITATYTPTGSGFSPIANGTYEIVSDSSGLALAANGTANGAAVVQQTYTSAATQQWTVTNLGNNVIEIALTGTSEVLGTPQAAAGTNLTVSAYTGSTSQQWTVVTSSSGIYELVNAATGYAVNVGGNSTTPGATICQWNANATLNELWSFTATGATPPPGTYALTVNGGSGSGSYAAGAAVTVTANAAPSGSQFSAWTGNTAALASSTSATTTLTMPAAATSITATYTPVVTGSSLIANGTYEIVSDSSNLALASNGTANGSAVVQQTYTSATTQQWTVTNLGNNVIELVLPGTSEALGTPQAAAGTNLTVSAYTGSTSQQWTVVASVSGFYELVNVATGFAINVGGNSTQSGSAICQWNANASLNELWSFTFLHQ